MSSDRMAEMGWTPPRSPARRPILGVSPGSSRGKLRSEYQVCLNSSPFLAQKLVNGICLAVLRRMQEHPQGWLTDQSTIRHEKIHHAGWNCPRKTSYALEKITNSERET